MRVSEACWNKPLIANALVVSRNEKRLGYPNLSYVRKGMVLLRRLFRLGDAANFQHRCHINLLGIHHG